MKVITIIFYLLSFPLSVLSTEKVIGRKEFRLLLRQIKEVAPEEFTETIASLKKKSKKYIYYQIGYCNGEFSSLVFSSKETIPLIAGEQASQRLSNIERVYCLKELLKDQIQYSQYLLYAQTNYLKYINKLELKQIRESSKLYIKKLQDELYQLDIKKKKKRRRKKKKSKIS